MHVNAELALELKRYRDGKPHDPDRISEAQRKGLIAPDPRVRNGLVFTRKGEEFLQKWN